MTYLASIATFLVLVGAFYLLIGQQRTRGEVVAFVLAIAAAFPLLEGGYLLVLESGRLQDGRVGPGVVTERLSSTGAEGTRTIGRSRRWARRSIAVRTIKNFPANSFFIVETPLHLSGGIIAGAVPSRPCFLSNHY